jgi:hypothetical protein
MLLLATRAIIRDPACVRVDVVCSLAISFVSHSMAEGADEAVSVLAFGILRNALHNDVDALVDRSDAIASMRASVDVTRATTTTTAVTTTSVSSDRSLDERSTSGVVRANDADMLAIAVVIRDADDASTGAERSQQHAGVAQQVASGTRAVSELDAAVATRERIRALRNARLLQMLARMCVVCCGRSVRDCARVLDRTRCDCFKLSMNPTLLHRRRRQQRRQQQRRHSTKQRRICVICVRG